MEAQELIDLFLNGHGTVIVAEAERAGLELALACALVEQESGGRNIFGCDVDISDPYEPPYCNVRVTEERVGRLLASTDVGGPSNGVGLTQLTYPPLIRSANDLGGAHLPRYQCRVGFDLLTDYIERYGLKKGIGAYNGGPSNPVMSYARSVLLKMQEWKQVLQ